ncbi:MAG: hypothetical protein MR051_06760 [Lentisphaeria bacterium]|nr:hypothetical protein [Lentisphaeria bacterium]
MNRNRAPRRFTLIELVVAVALLVVVAAITAMSGASFYNGYRRSLRATDRLKESMAIDNLMDSLVRNMIPFRWPDDDGTDRLVFNGDEHEMLFTTLRRTYGDRPGALIFIRVKVEEDELVAEYSPYPRPPWLEEHDDNLPWTREVLASGVRQVTFAYAENSTEHEGAVEFLETYLEEENSSLPLAVKMTVEWQDGRTEQWLRRVAGSGANSSFGMRGSATTSGTASGSTGTANGGGTVR